MRRLWAVPLVLAIAAVLWSALIGLQAFNCSGAYGEPCLTEPAATRKALGESIAVSGACLTVTSRRGRRFTAEVSPETLRRTTLGACPVQRLNARVNAAPSE